MVIAITFEQVVERIDMFAPFILCIISIEHEFATQLAEKVIIAQYSIERLLVVLIKVLKDILSELLYLVDDIPSLVFLHIGRDVFANPRKYLRVGVERVD